MGILDFLFGKKKTTSDSKKAKKKKASKSKAVVKKAKKKTASKTKKSKEKNNIYLYYAKALKHLDNDEFPLAVDNFTKVIDLLLEKDLPLELLSTTVFASGDELNVTFTLIDLYHLRGCAKFNISDDSSIDDFTESIKINENYEDAYYMRGSAYFILLEDWEKAIPEIKKYLTFSPDDKAGNQLLFVLKEIEQNAEKINKLYTKALDDYSEGSEMLEFVDDTKVGVSDEVVDAKTGNKLMKSCIKSLDKASELFSQKNRPNTYLKSHSFTLPEIYFKKLQCLLMLQEPHESIINQAVEIIKISKGLFKPNKSELGAEMYYIIVEKYSSEVKNKTSKPTKKKDDKSRLRVNWDETDDVGIVTYYKNKPFTGIAYSLYDNGNIKEEIEMVDGLKHGSGTNYSENGEIDLVLNYIDDELGPKDEKKMEEYLIKQVMNSLQP